MNCAGGGPIAPIPMPRDALPQMSDFGGKPGKSGKKAGEKPSLTCAVCKRRYQPIRTPGVHTIYSICPDCRLTAPS